MEVYLNEDYLKIAKDFDLPENFITSKAVAKQFIKEDKNLFKLNEEENISVLVKKAEGKKCPRCWKIFPGACVRCSTNN